MSSHFFQKRSRSDGALRIIVSLQGKGYDDGDAVSHHLRLLILLMVKKLLAPVPREAIGKGKVVYAGVY
jgi:hypothetical protein